MPGASVWCHNPQTGLEREAATNEEGIFRFSELPIGSYEVKVTKEGFKQLVHKDIQLLTAQVIDLKLTLEVGEVTQSVEVSGNVALVQTASSVVQTSIDTRQMKDLPLNGRNPLQLVALTAGAQLTNVGTLAGQQDNVGLTANGQRVTQNNFRLYGSNYNNRFFGSVPVMPNPDTLEEFTVQSANYSARTSGSGAVVELSTRSGTNQFHGSAFEFLRNTVLNARNFFQLQRLPFKLNQYGATFGGPVRKDKTFFFTSYQGTKQRSTPSSAVLTTPTAAHRRGDFSGVAGAIIDPQTGQPFPGNIIPQNRLDPLALRVLDEFVPLPNRGNQFVSPQNRNTDDSQYLIKIDHVFSQKNRLTGRYFLDNYYFQRPTNSVVGFFASNDLRNQSVTVRDTHSFSPILTLTTAFSYTRFARTQLAEAPGRKALQDFGAKVPFASENIPGFPGVRVFVPGFFNLFSGGGWIHTPQSYNYQAAALYSHGKHILQFGLDVERHVTPNSAFAQTPGTWDFTGQRTSSTSIPGSGFALADLMLGLPARFIQISSQANDLREIKVHPWVQDDWKITPFLTLNLGLRWEPWLPPVDALRSVVGFLPGVQSTVLPDAPRGLVFPGDPGVADSIYRKDWNNLAPRFGFAWDVFKTGRTVIRGGYGLFYNQYEYVNNNRTWETQPLVLNVNVASPPSFADPFANFPGGSPFPYKVVSSDNLKAFRFVRPVVGGVLDPNARTGYSQNWNLTLEQQVRSDLGVSLAYVGNLALKILGARELNPALLFGPGATLANTDARRLYANLGIGQMNFHTPFQASNFHSFQLNVTKRTARGLSLLANYVFSKVIDNSSNTQTGDTGPRNPFNLRLNRGPADFDTTHRAVMSLVYDIPKISKGGAIARALVNNWQINGIISLRSGLPFTVLTGRDNSLSGVGRDTADLIGDPTRPQGADKLLRWFNTAAFVPNALGTFGSVGRNSLRGPGAGSIDAAIFKNIKLSETLQFQFRAESYNIENRANFDNPNSIVSSGANFGRILGAADPRVFQFGLKFLF